MPFSPKNQAIQDKKTELFNLLPQEKIRELIKEINDRAVYLQDKYPDHRKREVFHIISGSGFRYDQPPDLSQDDFPGDDSVELFVDSLAAKYAV